MSKAAQDQQHQRRDRHGLGDHLAARHHASAERLRGDRVVVDPTWEEGGHREDHRREADGDDDAWDDAGDARVLYLQRDGRSQRRLDADAGDDAAHAGHPHRCRAVDRDNPRTRTDDLIIHLHRAGAADAVLTTRMRPGQTKVEPQKIDRGPPRLPAARHAFPLHRQGDVDACAHAAISDAGRKRDRARRVSTRAKGRFLGGHAAAA
jgi:hypothetical protein